MGEEYDPNLVEVHRIINLSINKPSYADTPIAPAWIFREYYIKNKVEKTSTDISSIINEFKRPAGEI